MKDSLVSTAIGAGATYAVAQFAGDTAAVWFVVGSVFGIGMMIWFSIVDAREEQPPMR